MMDDSIIEAGCVLLITHHIGGDLRFTFSKLVIDCVYYFMIVTLFTIMK